MPRSERVSIDGVFLSHRVHGAFARNRLGQALYEIALDAIDPAPALGAAELEWTRAAIARPIRMATEAALGTFTSELDRAFLDHAGAGHAGAPRAREGNDG